MTEDFLNVFFPKKRFSLITQSDIAFSVQLTYDSRRKNKVGKIEETTANFDVQLYTFQTSKGDAKMSIKN